MRHVRWLSAALALLLLCGAAAETSGGEGLSSDTVYHLELRLAALGYFSGKSDGTYDADTRTALEGFQQANGLEVTGAVDEATLNALNSDEIVSRQVYLKGFVLEHTSQDSLQVGSSGKDVQEVQRRLKELGYGNVRSDGMFGEGTQQAVKLFQLANGLEQTGVVDASTRMRLMAETSITWAAFLTEMSCVPGDTGLTVSALQKKLAALGYFDGDVTGSYGELTQQAVKRFQGANGLDQTGVADAATWEKLYGGEAVALRRPDALQRGDEGARVTKVRARLIELGYLSGEASGSFDYATETAVRLFQLGAGGEGTGMLDEEDEQALLAEDAAAIGDESVQAAYQALLEAANADTQAAIASAAEGLLGSGFGTPEDELYPGFAFVQYVCAAAGLPVRQPETLAAMAAVPVSDPAEVQAGDIVTLQSEASGSVSILLGVGAGEGKLYYATEEGGWVVLGYLDAMNSTNAYRWSAADAAGGAS